MSKFVAVTALAAALVSVGASGCAASTDVQQEDEEIEEADSALLKRGTSGVAGREIPADEVARILHAAGFADASIPKMVCTAFYESGWRDRSWNARNSNGTTDRGLFQVNSAHLKKGGLCARIGTEDLWDPAINASCAKKIFDAQGLGAWYGYRAHRATKIEGGRRLLGCDVYKLGDDLDTPATKR